LSSNTFCCYFIYLSF